MDLKLIVNQLYADSKRTPIRGLSGFAAAETYLQQAYEGRYFFELIQNVRDACKVQGEDGEIFIELTESTLTVANTGSEFSDKGIEGITTIGQSTKDSQDFIGFKGIGFKSVQEITNSPKIVTKYGTVVFNRELTAADYNGTLKDSQIPLFYLPHFSEKTLSQDEIQKGVVTRIELPLKKNTKEDEILESFEKIQARQLVLLGHIKNLSFKSAQKIIQFTIAKNLARHSIEVKKNDTEVYRFKNYSPSQKIVVPSEIIESLEGREKDIYSNSPNVDVNVVLELNDTEQIILMEDARLYLFYPLEIFSGFRFIIHSYFIVNPERKELRDSPLNSFLLSAIAEFIGIEVLQVLKKNRSDTTRILTFQRSSDSKLKTLYDKLVECLQDKRFIYNSFDRKYYKLDEVIVTQSFDKGLFSEGKLGDKWLVYIDDDETRHWLETEFNVPQLSYDRIAEEIENECKFQLKKRSVKFFQNLYNYISKHEDLNVAGKKVLVTQRWKLVSGDEDVFYGGGRRGPIDLPESVSRHIHFIHKDIKISDFREGRSRTGISEYTTYDLTRRLLKLFDKKDVPKDHILNVLFKLDLDGKSKLEIREKVLLPVTGSERWLSPIFNPIYFSTDELVHLYPNSNFVDTDVLVGDSQDEKEAFFEICGVWRIPAIYISEKRTKIPSDDSRENILKQNTTLSSKPYLIFNDRVLDKPRIYNSWFTEIIFEKWDIYRSFILNDSYRLEYSSSQSQYSKFPWSDDMTIRLTSFIETLKREPWIVVRGEDEGSKPKDVIGIDPIEIQQGVKQVIKKYLIVLPVNYLFKKEFIDQMDMVHLDTNKLRDFENLLTLIYEQNKDNDFSTGEFIRFYNHILSKLFEFYYFKMHQSIDLDALKKNHFLSVNEITNGVSWQLGQEIFYLDNKPNYDLLPQEIKEQLQPHFTNRDRNTFGKIAGQIGRRISSSIQKVLVKAEEMTCVPLVGYFPDLPAYLAIVEYSLDVVLEKQVQTLRKVKVCTRQVVELQVSIDGSPPTAVRVNHFVDETSNFDMHLINAAGPNRNRIQAEALTELFVKLLDRDSRKLSVDLLRFLNTIEKREYLRECDITDLRVLEFKDKLNASDLTVVQKFWDALLLARGISTREGVFKGDSVNAHELGVALSCEPQIICDFLSEFKFDNASSADNIMCIWQLLDHVGVSLHQLNEFLFSKIDFREHYDRQLTQEKNKFQKTFEALVYRYFEQRPREEQEYYLRTIDRYKYQFAVSAPIDSLSLKIEGYFVESLNKEFEFFHFTSEMKTNYAEVSPSEKFKGQLSLVKSLIRVPYTEVEFDRFLAENRKRSLLYFDNAEFIAASFTDFLATEKQINSQSTSIENPQDTGNDNDETSNDEIENFAPRKVYVPDHGFGKTGWIGGGGRRIDGGAANLYKSDIGLASEKLVFEILKKEYKTVSWVSRNAAKVSPEYCGYNPEGDDILGYDIEYFDDNDDQYFVEVKGRTEDVNSFEMSKHEIDTAHHKKKFYRVFLVTNVWDRKKRRIRDLGTLFDFPDEQDFFSNDKFSIVYRGFEIRFQ